MKLCLKPWENAIGNYGILYALKKLGLLDNIALKAQSIHILC
jgi:hypothetical protein